MGRKIHDSLTFDDVLLKPSSSSTLPKNVNTKTLLTKSVSLEIPIISAAMDTVTAVSYTHLTLPTKRIV